MFASGANNQNDNANMQPQQQQQQQRCNTAEAENIEDIENIDKNSCPMDTSECIDVNDYFRDSFNLSNIKVTVGIDEDLQMILEMDPSIVDLGVDVIGCTPATISPNLTPKSYGLPPILGG